MTRKCFCVCLAILSILKAVNGKSCLSFSRSHLTHWIAISVASFLLASCAGVERNIDFSKISPEDYNGFWQGQTDCGSDAPWHPNVEITIENGQAKLAHFGNWGNFEVSPVNEEGIIKWSGSYDNRQGSINPWSATAYWDRDVIHFRGARGRKFCTATLGGDGDKIPGLKARALRYVNYDPGDYAPVFQNNWKTKPRKRRAKLFYKNSDSPMPLVVLLHGFSGQGGARHFFNTIPIKIAEEGGASLVIRHRLSTDIPGRVVDTFMAINEAVKNPFIDPDRIYVFGVSAGGMQGLHMMHRPIHDALNDGNFKLAGLVLAYPNCRGKFESPEILPIPTLILTGDQDRFTPGSQCTDHIDEVGGASFMRQIHFANAGHSWMFSKNASTDSYRSWAPCGRLHIDAEGYWHWFGDNQSTSSRDLGFYDWLDKTDGLCAGPTTSKSGRVDEAYDRTIEYILEMVRGQLPNTAQK